MMGFVKISIIVIVAVLIFMVPAVSSFYMPYTTFSYNNLKYRESVTKGFYAKVGLLYLRGILR
jgi:hypothetical protein